MKKWKVVISTLAIAVLCASFQVKEAKALSPNIKGKRVQSNEVVNRLGAALSSTVNLDNFTLYKTETNVQPDKIWTLTFGQAVDISTVNDSNIGIIDESTYEKLSIQITTGTDGNTATVSLANGKKYTYGHTYDLYLTSDVKSKLNKNLKPTKLKFTIVQNVSEENNMYNMIKNTLINANSMVNVSNATDYDNDSIENIIDQVCRENPLILYLSDYTIYSSGKIEFGYSRSASITLAHQAAIQAKAKEIISQVIQSGMDDYQKEKAIHDYIINHASYDEEGAEAGVDNMPPEDFSAYGVLIKGIGVCESYAEAMQYIMQQLGIDCRIAEGTGNSGDGQWIPHEWDVIKINGNWYQLDPTWDDPVSSSGENILSYNYFNITDTEMRKDHRYSGDYPSCTATVDNYYYRNGLVAKNYDEFYSKIVTAIKNRNTKLEMKVLNYSSYTYNVKTAVTQAMKTNYDGVSLEYEYDVQGNVVTIYFYYK